MSDRLEKKLERIKLKKQGFYFEGHHIIPKSKGGKGYSNRPKNNSNIVLLTSREHFLAHWLLWRIYKDRDMALAFHKMSSTNKNQQRITSSRGYEESRMAFREINLGNQYGKGVKKVISDEQKKKQSEIMKGRYMGDLNPSKNPDVRKKISEKLKGVKKSDSHIEKMKNTMKNKEKILCPFCNILTNSLNAKKWHFEYCNLNPNQKERPKTIFNENNKYGCKKIIVLDSNIIYDSISEVAKLYNVAPITITRWLKKGNKVKYYNLLK